jgi:hypothetical protein
MFSLADPDSTEGILAASGFAEVGCTEVHAPVCCGLDAATAEEERGALQRLRAIIGGRNTGSGVLFDPVPGLSPVTAAGLQTAA